MKRLIILPIIVLIGIIGICIYRYQFRRLELCHLSTEQISLIRTGDLLFSEGHSLKSDLVRIAAAQYHSNYSHVGFLRRTSDTICVVHMSINDGYMMEESLGDFIRRNQVLHIGIYRLVQVPDSIRLSQILDSLIAIPKIFDYDFDMNDDRELYCTELIINVLNKINKDIPFRPASDGILYPPMLLDHHLLTPIINPYEKNDY